jgi:beta-N-acetylhexosaminidase
VITNSANTVIGDRSFGSDPILVKDCAISLSKGLKDYGVMSTFKHFPGHGATDGDTHEGFAYTNKTYEELKQTELVPFVAAQEGGVDAIMIAHISLPNVVGDNTPCTLSYKVVAEILRDDLGFEGLIITDAMNMGAIVDNYDSESATIKAVQAGCDVILMPEDFHAAAEALIKAVENGIITEECVDASVERIITKKYEISIDKYWNEEIN